MEDLIIILDKLGYLFSSDKKVSFNLKDFNNRLFYQKLIFLVKINSNHLNYHFNWYLRGPYSPSLTRDLFSIEELSSQNQGTFSYILTKNQSNLLYDEDVSQVNNLKEKINQKFHHEWDYTDLEILASLLFIDKYTYSSCRSSKENAIEELIERKPEMKHEPLDKYWDLLKVTGFIH